MSDIQIFAHRGLKSEAPENTLSAFKKALEHKIDGIEFDVQMTKDKKLVVIHDETVDRTTNGKGFVKDFTYDELLSLDAGSWFSSEFRGEKIPLLEDVLELVSGYDIKIHLELKTARFEYDGIENEVMNKIDYFELRGNTIFSSFNHYTLKRIKDLNKNAETAILCEAVMYNPESYLKNLGANAIHTHIYTINKSLTDYARRNGILVRCYTVNNEKDFNRMVELNIDGVFSDNANEILNLKYKA